MGQNKTNKYLKYAMGEILLVVVGILIALQLNNYNEKRKNGKYFKVSLDHLYTSIKVDLDILHYYENTLNDQITAVDEILMNSDDMDTQLLLNLLYYLETDPNLYSSETAFHLSSLTIDPNNKNQNNVTKRIAAFVNNEWWDSYFSPIDKRRIDHIEPILNDSDIPSIPVSFGFSPIDYPQLFPHVFSDQDIEDVRQLISSRKFQNALTALKLNKNILSNGLITFIEDSQSILSLIKEFYPEVRLLHENIGIVGDALESGWFKSVPMTLLDDKEALWEIKTQLKKGRIKFRANDSWTQNWGENTYAPGSLVIHGKDIEVEEGFYLIRVNLSNNNYTIKRL